MRLRLVALLGIALGVATMPGRAATVSLHLVDRPGDPEFGSIELRGLSDRVLGELARVEPQDEAWRSFFATYPEPAGSDLPAMLGRWRLEPDVVRFLPRFPLVAGLTYRSIFDSEALSDLVAFELPASTGRLVERFALPQAEGMESPGVAAVHPSSGVVPANLLRFYVSFSEPMHALDVADHVRLLDEKGEAIVDAFVSIPHGLWDESGRRYTLLVHPGRIKRGVGPHRVQGPVLESGRTYSLVIDSRLESRSGRPLGADFVHRFEAGPEDRRRPDPRNWEVRPPETETQGLVVEFGESIDAALALRWLAVVRESDGVAVRGERSLGANEASWRFEPIEAWSPGAYRLEVAAGIEDVAGNTPHRLFDEEGAFDATRERTEDPLCRSFRVGPFPAPPQGTTHSE